jgi:peroxiredoxin Q/BCP
MSTLAKGDKAPLFTLKNQDGESVALKDLQGEKVVLYFYPKDDTPGCTKQACNIRDNSKVLKKHKINVYGISPDDEESHQQFIKKFKLNFQLLADPKKKAIEKYDVWVERNMYGNKFMGIKRTTFLINEDGNIHHIIKGVKTAEQTEQILKYWDLS